MKFITLHAIMPRWSPWKYCYLCPEMEQKSSEFSYIRESDKSLYHELKSVIIQSWQCWHFCIVTAHVAKRAKVMFSLNSVKVMFHLGKTPIAWMHWYFFTKTCNSNKARSTTLLLSVCFWCRYIVQSSVVFLYSSRIFNLKLIRC